MTFQADYAMVQIEITVLADRFRGMKDPFQAGFAGFPNPWGIARAGELA